MHLSSRCELSSTLIQSSDLPIPANHILSTFNHSQTLGSTNQAIWLSFFFFSSVYSNQQKTEFLVNVMIRWISVTWALNQYGLHW